MRTFWTWLEWLIAEARPPWVEPGILQGYEHAFKEELRKLIQRTGNPNLRSKLEHMLDCPIVDGRGQCRSFTNYILSALLKNGIQYRFDIEAALGYVVEKMLMDKGDDGSPRPTVFGGFEERPSQTRDFNPLQARFLKYLQFAVNNIRKGKIVRLAATWRGPPGTVSIGQGRWKEGDPDGGVSPDQIEARPSHDADLGEIVQDIEMLLKKKESAYGFPLVDLFRAIMGGMNLAEQRRRFGDRKVRTARQAVIQTVEEYAKTTGNLALLNMVRRLRDGQDRQEAQARTIPVKSPKAVLPDKERDYASIASVVARFDRPVGTADLCRFRRRWLEYPPRIPGSGHRNRLEEVLAAMVRDGVLKAIQTRSGATVYEPGPNFQEFHRQEVEVG